MILDQGVNLSKNLVHHPLPETPEVFEEVILYSQGFIVKASLPPIYDADRLLLFVNCSK